jgi:hypothetical protein
MLLILMANLLIIRLRRNLLMPLSQQPIILNQVPMEQMALLQDPLPELQDQQMLLQTQKINPKQMNQKILLLLMMSNYLRE